MLRNLDMNWDKRNPVAHDEVLLNLGNKKRHAAIVIHILHYKIYSKLIVISPPDP